MGRGLLVLVFGVSSSHRPKAEGGSLKCSHWRRQRQIWEPVPAEWPEWICALQFGERMLYTVFPMKQGVELFTYVTIYICADVTWEGDHPWGLWDAE